MTVGISANLSSTGTAVSYGRKARIVTTAIPPPMPVRTVHSSSLLIDVLLVVVSVVSTLLVVAVVLLIVLTRLLRRVAAAHRTHLASEGDGEAEVQETVGDGSGFARVAARASSDYRDEEQQPLLQQQQQQQQQQRHRDANPPGLLDTLGIVLRAGRGPREAPSRARAAQRSPPNGGRHAAEDGAPQPLLQLREAEEPRREPHDARVTATTAEAAAVEAVGGAQTDNAIPHSRASTPSVPYGGAKTATGGVAAAVAANDGEEATPFHAASAKDLVVFRTTHDSRYRLLQRIGMGAFSSVYLVQHKVTGQRYALKYILCKDDRERLAALRECELIHTLQHHPQVIRIVDMFMNYQFQGGTASAAVAAAKTAPMRMASANSAVAAASHTRHVGVGGVRAATPSAAHVRPALPWQVTSTGNATLRATSQLTAHSLTQSPSLCSRPAPLLAAANTPTSQLSLPDASPSPLQLQPQSQPSVGVARARMAAAEQPFRLAASPPAIPRVPSTAAAAGPLPQRMPRYGATPASPSLSVLAGAVAPPPPSSTKWVGVQLQGLHDKAMTKVASAARLEDAEVLAALRARLGPMGFHSDGAEPVSDVDTDERRDESDGNESETAPLILSAADTERLLMDARLLQQRRHRQRAQTRQQRYHRQRSNSNYAAAAAAAAQDNLDSHSTSVSSLLMPRQQQQQQQQQYLPSAATAAPNISVQHASRSSSRGVLPSPSTSSSSHTRGSMPGAGQQPTWRPVGNTYGTCTQETATAVAGNECSAPKRFGRAEFAEATAARGLLPASSMVRDSGAGGQPMTVRYTYGGGGPWDARLNEQLGLPQEDGGDGNGGDVARSISGGTAGPPRTANASERDGATAGLHVGLPASAFVSGGKEEERGRDGVGSTTNSSSSGSEEEPVQPVQRILVPPPSYMHPPPCLNANHEEGTSQQQQQQPQRQQPSSPTSYVSRNRYANFALDLGSALPDEPETPLPTARPKLTPSPAPLDTRNVLEAALIDADVDAPTPAAAVAAAQASLTRSSYAPRESPGPEQQQQQISPSPGAPSSFPATAASPSPPAATYASRRALASAAATTGNTVPTTAAEKRPLPQTPPSPALLEAPDATRSSTNIATASAGGVVGGTYAPSRDVRAGHYVNPYLERACGGEVVPPPRTSYAPGGGVRYNSLVGPTPTPTVMPTVLPTAAAAAGFPPAPEAAANVRNSYAPLRYGNLVQPVSTPAAVKTSTPTVSPPPQQQLQSCASVNRSPAPPPSSSTSAAAGAARSTSGRISVSAAIRSARAGQQGERMHLHDGKTHVHVPTPHADASLASPHPLMLSNEPHRTLVTQHDRGKDDVSEEARPEESREQSGAVGATAHVDGVAVFTDAPSPQHPLYTNLGVALADTTPAHASSTASAAAGAAAAHPHLLRSAASIPSYGATASTHTSATATTAHAGVPVVRYANAGNPTLWCAYGQPGGAATGPATVAAARATAADEEKRGTHISGTATAMADGAPRVGNNNNNNNEDDNEQHNNNSSAGGTGSTTQSNSSNSLTQDVRDTGYLCLVMEYHPMGDLCHYVLRAKQQLALQQEQQMRNSVSHATLDGRAVASPTSPSDHGSLLFGGGDGSADVNSPTLHLGSSTTSWVAAAAAATWRMKPATRRSQASLFTAEDDTEDDDDPTRHNPLTEPQLLSIAYQLSSVLDHMHRQSPPIIHRDLKPENILIKGELTDFLDGVPLEAVRISRNSGLIRLVSKPASPLSPAGPAAAAAAAALATAGGGGGGNAYPDQSSVTPYTPSLVSARGNGGAARGVAGITAPPPIRITRAVVPIVVTDFGLAMVQEAHGRGHGGRGGGTRPYIAPECWQGATCTASDVWSLGCVLYALATGRLTARTVRLMSDEARQDGFASRMLNDLIVQQYSLAFASFVVSLLVVDPAKRPSAAQAAQCFLVSESDVRFDLTSPFFSNVFDL